MSSLSAVGRSAAARKNDRVSLCSFTFSDGRRCRTPRSAGHPHLCSDHARKDSQARAADKLARDLSFFFSGQYLSACDLTAALGRLIVSVAHGDIKPRSARTLAYLAQTLVQTIHLAQDEYINAFDTDGWRRAVRNSVKGNHDHLFPPAPKPSASPQPPQNQAPQQAPVPQPSAPSSNPPQRAPIPTVAHPVRGEAFSSPSPQPHSAQTAVNCHSDAVAQDFRPEESSVSSSPAHPPTHDFPHSETATPSGPTPSPHTPLPNTSAEFAQHVVVAIQPGKKSSPPPTRLKSTHTEPPASVVSKPLT